MQVNGFAGVCIVDASSVALGTVTPAFVGGLWDTFSLNKQKDSQEAMARDESTKLGACIEGQLL